ncbi:DUF2207 domain-containing protein [Arsenicitalea aurantiaca]|uniref:DUF2207 domain-containing protein n=1 Tax=Arsenicitalea aurantiaca TaxID=1783274 RepID=A0A433XAN3_9HYPH|nr:DUF2207 domain-containing protein [Arsenicitalea aurantiaca]RUT31139.1 DUF2207 domain-containing protein [Arsenicitalea aurantiaca]
MSHSARAGGLAARLLALVFCLILAVLPVGAQEVIRSFEADVTLRTDGSVAVTETITVNAAGLEIRRGIFRDIPTLLQNPDGSRLRSAIFVERVTRNGQAEPFAVETITNGARIRIGSSEVLLDPGLHRYTISYTMSRMARRFADHDELYWNATGNFWAFPIEAAVATITLPDGAVITDLTGFTGPQGATEQALTITRLSDTRAQFRSDRTLGPQEGMTVVVALGKGVLSEPEGLDRIAYYLSDHRDLILPPIAVLIVLLYYLLAWSAVGRDPAKGTIIPRFYAPKGYSPALVHYIHNWGWKKSGWTAFTASLFDLGVKGLVEIDNRGKTLSITHTGKAAPADLPPGQRVLEDFVRREGVLRVDKETGSKIHKKRGEFVSAIEAENRQVYFLNNYAYVALGLVLSLGAIVVLIWSQVLAPIWLFAAFAGGIGVALLTGAVKALWNGSGIRRFLAVIWFGVIIANIGGGLLGQVPALEINTAALAAGSIVLINVVFAILMRAPTVQGRKRMDEIEGLRMYLETAEKERLNISGEPPMTVERFEALLPYAIALEVEKPWAEHFEGELARNAVADAQPGYRPVWYSGSGFSSGNLSRTIGSVATGVSAAMIASQPVSASSSGFSGGGGGFSGGGGGGGGGGGW